MIRTFLVHLSTCCISEHVRHEKKQFWTKNESYKTFFILPVWVLKLEWSSQTTKKIDSKVWRDCTVRKRTLFFCANKNLKKIPYRHLVGWIKFDESNCSNWFLELLLRSSKLVLTKLVPLFACKNFQWLLIIIFKQPTKVLKFFFE